MVARTTVGMKPVLAELHAVAAKVVHVKVAGTDRHAVRELAPIHGINLGFQNFIGFLLLGIP